MDRLFGIASNSKRGRLAASIALAIITLRLSLFVLNFIGGSNLFNQLGVLLRKFPRILKPLELNVVPYRVTRSCDVTS